MNDKQLLPAEHLKPCIYYSELLKNDYPFNLDILQKK